MHTISIAVTFFACAGYGHRVKTTSEQMQNSLNEEHQNSQRADNSILPLLLALSNPAAAFAPPHLRPGTGHNHKLAMNNPNGVRTGSHASMMSQNAYMPGVLPLTSTERYDSFYDWLLANGHGPAHGLFHSDELMSMAHLPMWLNPHGSVPPSVQQQNSQQTPPIDFAASAVISKWAQIASKYANIRHLRFPNLTEVSNLPTRARNNVSATDKREYCMLAMMAAEIKTSPPDEVLALVSHYGIFGSKVDLPSSQADKYWFENIFAMATASKRVQADDTGKLEDIAQRQGLKQAFPGLHDDGYVPVVEIGKVVASPLSAEQWDAGGVGKELLLQIVKRAAASGHLVVHRPISTSPSSAIARTDARNEDLDLEAYYEELGFERIDASGVDNLMVYSKPVPEEPNFIFDMGSLWVA